MQRMTDLIEQYGKPVYSFCLYLTRNKTEADDLYQETFLKALGKVHVIDDDKNPKGFLMAISIRLWKSKKRQWLRRQTIAPMGSLDDTLQVESQENVENQVLAKEEIRLIRQSIAKLDQKYQLPVYLYYTAEISVEEIGNILKIPAGTVKSRLFHARKKIQKDLEAAGYE